MDAPRRHSASPDDRSEGNDSMSAPSEFLAEFLSAIMRRQYAEALKYCRLILQYEPHNATARGFYPLLQHKLAHGSAAARRSDDPDSGASSASSGEEGSPRRASPHEEVMEQDADSSGSERAGGVGCAGGAAGGAGGAARRSASSGSVASQSSLELDSSDAPARSSPDASLDLSRTDRTDSASASASGSGWDSSGSAPSSARDDNGNFAPLPHATCACDAENNAPGSAPPSPRPPPSPRAPPAPRPLVLGSDESAASLRRLRAQFACSIK